MKNTISFRANSETDKYLNELQQKTGKDCSFLINDAIIHYKHDYKRIIAKKIYLLEKELNYQKALLQELLKE